MALSSPHPTADNADWNAKLQQLASSPTGTDIAGAVAALTPAGPDWHLMLHHEVALALYARDAEAARPLIVSRLRASDRMLIQLYQTAVQHNDAVLIEFMTYRLLYHMPAVFRKLQHADPTIRLAAQQYWDWANSTIIARYTDLYNHSPEEFAVTVATMATCDARGTWALGDESSPAPAVQFIRRAHPEAICNSIKALGILLDSKRLSARKWALGFLQAGVTNDEALFATIAALRDSLISIAKRETRNIRRNAALAPLQLLAQQHTDLGDATLADLLRLSDAPDPLGQHAMIAFVRARHARSSGIRR